MSAGSAASRREELVEIWRQANACTSCDLHETRTKVVFGSGDADARLMFVGEAPGAEEDRTGMPFVGRAGRLLDQLLADIGIGRDEVFIANVLKCRPPSNRDPAAGEIERCRPFLDRQVELVRPEVVCTLGNFATKLLTGDQTGITKVHGQPRSIEIGSSTVTLLPLLHPAAGLRSPKYLDALRVDFGRIPDLLAEGRAA